MFLSTKRILGDTVNKHMLGNFSGSETESPTYLGTKFKTGKQLQNAPSSLIHVYSTARQQLKSATSAIRLILHKGVR